MSQKHDISLGINERIKSIVDIGNVKKIIQKKYGKRTPEEVKFLTAILAKNAYFK